VAKYPVRDRAINVEEDWPAKWFFHQTEKTIAGSEIVMKITSAEGKQQPENIFRRPDFPPWIPEQEMCNQTGGTHVPRPSTVSYGPVSWKTAGRKAALV
jgi:hypothetical protein